MLTAFQAPAAAVPVDLCVGVVPMQQSIGRGQTAQWEVGAWTEGGNVPDARVQLQATAGAGVPAFTFGCAAGNGTSGCDLGAVDAGSAQHLFVAAVSVPLTTPLNAVSLTVSGSAAGLATAPAASASVTLLAAGTPAASSAGSVGSASLPPFGGVGNAVPTPTLSPGGNAAGLFPAVAPTPTLSPSPKTGKESPAANVSALHNGSLGGTKVADVVGLGALTVAVFLALTRISFRRPVPRQAGGSPAAAAPPPAAPTAFITAPAPAPPPAAGEPPTLVAPPAAAPPAPLAPPPAPEPPEGPE